MYNSNKIIIISGTSGSGKTTLVNYLLQHAELNLAFSISACSRPKRPLEKNGEQYVFLSEDEFRKKIKMDDFLEWEEVYPAHLYGTLKSSCETLLLSGKNILFDVDVQGALSIKSYFKDRSRSVFVQPSSITTTKDRLMNRSTENTKNLAYRIGKMKNEIKIGKQMDYQLLNDELDLAKSTLYSYVKSFILQ